MKNLHKKIGAMVLAGMVVLGGVAAGGGNSFAASSNRKVVKNNLQQSNYQKVERIVNKYFNGEILIVNNEEKEFNKSVKKECINKKISLRNIWRDKHNIKNQYSIPVPLNDAKNRGRKLVEIQFQGYYYLIQLNQ